MTAILIVHHKTFHELERLLEALREESPTACGSGPILVVDVASGDSRLERLPEVYPEVTCLALQENVGFSAAVNVGLRELEDRRVLLLNADVVLTREQVTALEGIADRAPERGESPAALGPLHRYEDGAPQLTWGADPSWRSERRRRRLTRGCTQRDRAASEEVLAEAKETREVDWLSGSCILIDRTAPGGGLEWDEGYSLYFEDMDWCRRVREAGGRVVHTPEVTVVHAHGASMKTASASVTRAAYRRGQMRYAARFLRPANRVALRLYLSGRIVSRWLISLTDPEERRSVWAELRAIWQPL